MLASRKTLFKSERVFTTGEIPLLVTCSDFTDWVCKHGRMHSSSLFNEVIGSKFAKIWKLKTPPISLIEVSKDHLPNNYLNKVQPAFFNKPCFGSFYIENSQVVDKTLLPSIRKANFRRKIANKKDILKIALFDIWLSNEDRHHANSNLLLDQTIIDEYYFNVFDHGAIFNSNSLIRGLYLIDNNESIIYSELVRILFSKVNNLTEIVDNIVQEFYLYTTVCEQELSNILMDIPDEWELNLENLELHLRKNLFADKWHKDCEIHFRTLIQAYIIK